MTESRIGQKMKAYCSSCKGERNCDIHGHYAESDDDGLVQWYRDWYLLVCRGCEHVFAQSVSTDSESRVPYYAVNGEVEYEHEETIVMWPARAKRDRPQWFDGNLIDSKKSTHQLDASLLELYGALDNDLNVLASIGMRTSFDIAAENLGVDPGLTFQQKITDLLSRGAIKPSEKDHIDILVDAGSASAHRGWKPRIAELNTLMEILEGFIFNNFVLPEREQAKADEIAKIKAKVPAKAAKPKSKTKAKPAAKP
uniref:DUF4145 domain-containing protein n=1 Tax=Agrobacterium albertimagni TaxID=147266 RepID=A0A7C1NYU1_9HYPH